MLLQQATERQRPGRQQRVHAEMQQVPRGHPPMLLDMLRPRRNVLQTLLYPPLTLGCPHPAQAARLGACSRLLPGHAASQCCEFGKWSTVVACNMLLVQAYVTLLEHYSKYQ